MTEKAADRPSEGAEVQTSNTGGQKQSKPEQFFTMPPEAVGELARVYKFGAARYAPYNFRLGYPFSLSFDAMMRHAWAWQGGEDEDPESGLSHMAHAAWHALNLVLFMSHEHYDQFDDRPTGLAADYGTDE